MLMEATAVHSHEVHVSYANGSRFEGRYSVGTTAHPFRVRRQGEIAQGGLTRVSGAYTIDTPLCSSGSMRVETLQDLEFDLAPGYSAGKLRLVAANGSSATVTFLGGGRVRIENGGGVSEIEDWHPSSIAWYNECFGQWVE
jgi:hypothetical protein